MRGFNVTIHNEQGATFVEVLVAGVVGLIVAGAVFYFVGFAGQGTQQIGALQQLEQESSLITELFTRTVRNGSFVCIGNQTTAPAVDTDNVSQITVRAADSSVLATFGVASDSLIMNGNKYLTAYLCKYQTPQSHFKIFQNGKTAECYLSMFAAIGANTTYYTQTIGDVRCRN